MMESLKRSFRTLSVSQRTVMGASLVVAVIAVAVFGRWVSTPSYTVLYSGLDSATLGQVIDSLDSAGVSYQIGGGGDQVLVPRAQVYQVRASLAGEGIQGSVVPQGYELLDQQGLSVSDFRQKVDYQRALEGELSKTLSAMSNIQSATVHLVIPQEALFAENQQPVTASVLVATNGTLGQSDIEAITLLVSSSVEGLEVGNVTVADTSGTVLHAAGEDSTTAVGNRQLRMTREYETALANDVNAMLASMIGPGRASVVVRAELDYDQRSTETETYTPESATPLRQQNTSESFTGSGTVPVGSVGVDGQAIGTGSDGPYEYQRNEDTTEYGIDKVVVKTVDAPGTIQHLSVAVVVDDGSLTGAQTPDVTTVQSLVAAAIGVQADRGDTIEVSAVPFPAPDTTTDTTAEAATTDSGGGVMSLIPTIIGALVLLLVASALFLMSRGSKKGAVAAVPVAALPADLGGAEFAPGSVDLGSMTADVQDMVDRQPEEIAVLLRSWLADRRETAVS